jgi:hypothetical protein
MNVIEASFSGTFRTILVLVLVWWALRYLLGLQARRRSPNQGHPPRHTPGRVTVERSSADARGRSGQGPVIVDADFEEIK